MTPGFIFLGRQATIANKVYGSSNVARGILSEHPSPTRRVCRPRSETAAKVVVRAADIIPPAEGRLPRAVVFIGPLVPDSPVRTQFGYNGRPR